MNHHTFSHKRTSPVAGDGEGPGRKALQLCHQVAETLDEVLAECADPLRSDERGLD